MSRNTSATKKTILHRIEGLFENKNNSVKDIRESLLKYSKEVGLDYHELNHIWDLAIANASEKIRNKVSISVIPFAKDEWLENILVKHHILCLEMKRDWTHNGRPWTEEDKEHCKWDIKMSEEILYLIKKNDDCKLLTLDGCQFTWLVEWLYFLKSIENCTDITDIKHKKCKDNLKMVDQYLKIYISKMLNLNRLIVFLEYTISRERHPDTLCLCGCNDYDKSEILQVKNTLRITKQILRLCREVARGAKQLILTKEQRECLHQELSNYLKLRQLACHHVSTPNNELSENELQTINWILTDITRQWV